MQRGTSLAFALLFAAAVAVVVLQTRAPTGGRPTSRASAEKATPVEEPKPGATGAATSDAGSFVEADADTDGPELPPGAPKSVGFGVVLVTYAGAQFAPEKARTKQQAQQLARQLIDLAKQDFEAAVKKGDRGSTIDAGTIPRGVLEPAVERALFGLAKGSVHEEPLDTPRGFWIVRRTE